MTVLFKNSSRTCACVRTHEKSLKSTVITVTTVTLPQEATTRLRGKTWTFSLENMGFLPFKHGLLNPQTWTFEPLNMAF